MKKRLFITLINLIFIITFVFAHHDGIAGQAVSDVSENIPKSNILNKLEIDPSTGQPKSIVEAGEKIDKYKEQNTSYLAKEWTKILADNKFFGPVLSYSDKFFSVFNPFWKAVFKIPFSWSWTFFFSFVFLVIFIVLIYYLLIGLFKNKLVDFIVSIIIASLIGVAGAIQKIVDFLSLFITNPIALIIILILIILTVVFYVYFMKKLMGESKETELEMSKESIKALGRVSKEGLREMGK